MALQPSVTPYLRKITANNVRTFAAAAKAKKAEPASSSSSSQNPYSIPREELKVSKVSDNVTAVSVETSKPLARLAVYFRAGSRYETDSTQGTVQMLRIAAGLGTGNSSQFSLTRTLEANGANLHCTTGREFVGYTVESNRDKIKAIEPFLKEIASNQVFKPWELKDNVNRLRLERDIRPPEVRILELIHKAAYRKGLGYSLYSPKWMIGNHTSEMLSNYVKSNFGEATVVAVGLPHDQVKTFASRLKLQGAGTDRTSQPSKFAGGTELRKETNSDLAYVALAVEGASIGNAKDQVASALVHRALGSGARTKRGTNAGGKLTAAVSGDVSLNAAATTFSVNYSDSGLLGVFIAATPCSVEGVTKKAAEILLTGNFSDEDVARAKTQLKNDISFTTETDAGFLEEVALQSLLTGNIQNQTEIEALIDSVTAGDLNALVKKGKLSMASFGRVANVPHIEQLKK